MCCSQERRDKTRRDEGRARSKLHHIRWGLLRIVQIMLVVSEWPASLQSTYLVDKYLSRYR